MQPLWTELYTTRADVVLGTHYQFYERFALQTPAGVADALGGRRIIKDRTGGQSWSSFGTPLPRSEVRATQTWGGLKLTLHATSYDWQFVPIAGQTFTDAGSTACHSKAALPVASVTVSPSAATVPVGGTQQLTATPLDANGNPLSGRTITWTTSAPGVATVDANGLVSAVATGSATITATSEGKSGTAAITVSSTPVASVAVSPASATLIVGATQQLTATPLDANGNPLSGRTISWTTSALGVATVDANGLVTGVATGSATITATSEGKSGTSAITVQVPVASVSVSPTAATILVGGTQQLTATPLDADGNPLSGRTVTWVSSNTAVATVSASGLVTGVAPGSATITATSEGKSGTATITVNPPPVATVTVSPASASIRVGSTVQLTATLKDANGNVLTGRTVTWTSSNTKAATVNASGLVTALATGSATITATSEGKSGTSIIKVRK